MTVISIVRLVPAQVLLAGKPAGKPASDPLGRFTNPGRSRGEPSVKVGDDGEIRVTNPKVKRPATEVTPRANLGKPGTNPGAAPNSGAAKAAEIANPKPNGRAFTNIQKVRLEAERLWQPDPLYKARTVKLEGDRYVVLRARKDGRIFIDIPSEYEQSTRRVSWNVAGISTKNTPEQIQQAIKKLCSDPRKIPYVFDSGMRVIANVIDDGPRDGKTFLEERHEFENAIESYPPVIKELVGVAGGIWFETLGKMGHSVVQVTDAQQAVAKQITANPPAWKQFINSSFAGDDAYAKDCRKYLGEMPKSGANDAKTTLAIFLALDRKAATKLRDLGRAIETDPVGVATRMALGIKAMVKQEVTELFDTSNIGIYLGTLAAKLATSWIPTARSGAAGAKLFASLLKNSPQLLKTMGAASYKAAISTLEKADARLTALAAKVRTGAGLSVNEKAQKTGLTNQINAATQAIADGNDEKLSAAVNKTETLLGNKNNVTDTSAAPSLLDPDPPGALVHQPKDVQIPEVDSVLNKRIAGARPETEAQRRAAVQTIMDYPGTSVKAVRETMQPWADDALRNLRDTAEGFGFTPNQVPPPYQNLTTFELAAIQFWTGRGFRPANGSLIAPRQIGASQSKYGAADGTYVRAAAQYAKVLDDTLARLPKVRGTFIRHDTLSDELIAKYKVNSTVEWPAFSSASAKKGVFTTRNCRFEIEGNPVDLRGFNPWEREVIFRPGSRFKVLSIDNSTAEPGKTVIKLKQVE